MPRIVKPRYVDPVVYGGGQELTYRPPLLFREVTARVFPLKANIARLAEFCDQYLNMDIPDEIVHFTPALPYVYFMALNYGGMSATSVHAQRLGWVSQHEAFFLVPLARWRREHGKMAFQGWTSATPFIFVDDPLSAATGREVYGWPKAQAWIEADRPAWTTHPRAPTRLYTLSVDIFHDVYAGQREPPRTLVTIDRDVEASYAEYPLNYKCPWSITSVIPNLYATSLSLMEEAADIAANLRLRGFPDFRTGESLAEMAREGFALTEQMLAGFWPWPASGGEPLSGTYARSALVEDLPRFFTSTINVKQFRAPEDPDLACYTALVESAMGVDRINQVGLLGDWDLLRGDKSGGYSLSINRYRAQPILETLGVETPNLYERPREGETVTLRPSFPFWMDFDLYYGAGDVICSRTPQLLGGRWIEESEAERQRVGRVMDRTPRRGVEACAYNTALGAATLPITGPMHFPDLTVQVYPLRADREILAEFVRWSWTRLFEGGDERPKLELELVGSYVYLTVETVGSAHGRMWSGTENIGQWKEREVAFAIPVRWKLDGEFMGLAMIEPLIFADKARAVATDREVIGRNSFMALIESPPDVWAAPGGPGAPRKLARVSTESFVELGYGLESKSQTLLEIDERGVGGVMERGFERGLHEDLARKAEGRAERGEAVEAVQAMALEILARGAPVNRLSLKQYRDAAEFDRACYQAVVHSQRRFERIYEICELERSTRVKLHRLANYPIVETLGLKVKHTRSGTSVVDELEPVRPFWLRASVCEDLGRVVAAVNPHLEPDGADDPPRHWRLIADPPKGPDATRWPPVAAPPSYFRGGGVTAVGARFVEALREGAKTDLPRKLDALSRRMLLKELQALRRAKGMGGGARDRALSLESLRAAADALRAELPAWRPPERRVRAAELERLGALVLHIEKQGEEEPTLAAVADDAMRARCAKVLEIFAAPDRPTDPDLRAADARSLYEIGIALERRGGEPPESAAGPASAACGLIGRLKRLEQWIIVGPPDGSWRFQVPEAAARALDRVRVKRFVAEYDFDAERFALFEAGFPDDAAAALETLEGMAEQGPFAKACRRHKPGEPDPVAALARVAEAVADDVEDWADPRRWLRMTRSEALRAVEALPDLQLVIEAILDDRWERPPTP
jgi:hypothetical protein